MMMLTLMMMMMTVDASIVVLSLYTHIFLVTSFLSEQRTANSTRSRQEKDANLSGS